MQVCFQCTSGLNSGESVYSLLGIVVVRNEREGRSTDYTGMYTSLIALTANSIDRTVDKHTELKRANGTSNLVRLASARLHIRVNRETVVLLGVQLLFCRLYLVRICDSCGSSINSPVFH